MKLTATVENASEVAEGVWHVPAAMDQVLHDHTVERFDLPSILVVEESDFEHAGAKLQFDFGSAQLLILGGRARGTLIIQAAAPPEKAVHPAGKVRGDELFLQILGSMAPNSKQVGEDLLERIRELDPEGSLERQGRRFINRPDNFVALEPQTRINEIIVHIRGIVSVDLQPVATQRGYSAFKVRSVADLLEAGRALGLAKRKF